MNYFAVTQGAASWVIGKASIIDALHRVLVVGANTSPIGPDEEFIEGPFRLSVSSDGEVVAFWSLDYLSGTGDEAWGFVKLVGSFGIAGTPSISREVFERCLYVISQRLQGLTIDGAFFPRSYPSGAHTCLAGRGTDARHVSIGYFERQVGGEELRQQAIICVGPEQNWRQIEAAAKDAGTSLPRLVSTANQLIAPGRKVRLLPSDGLSDVRYCLVPFTRSETARHGLSDVEIAVDVKEIDQRERFNAAGLTYTDWITAGSCLTAVQRRILESDELERHPLRIVGPGGSGKTLLMQLLTVRRLRAAQSRNEPLRLLYLVHNQAMANMVRQRFDVLMSEELLEQPSEASLSVKTLSQIARELLELEEGHVIDVDAHEAKEFQYEEVQRALRAEIELRPDAVDKSRLLSAARSNREIFAVLAVLIMSDISIAIKGHGLERDKRRYVQSARSLSRFHGILNEDDREFVYTVFERYHKNVFESLEVLDSDDLAISLLGRLRTPIWELRRRQLGYDYVFVDETQLFNENERRVIPLLTNGIRRHVPVALALDEAQAVYGQSAAGFASLGIEGITSESLGSIHRSTKSIVDLAFFVIQRSTDLFGPDFPNFTDIAERLEPDTHPLAAKPCIETVRDNKQGLGKFVRKRVGELRKNNIRKICIIVHADQYWDDVLKELQGTDLPLHLLLTRGEYISPEQPIVALSKPAFVGGQEFDAVVLVGLEQGVVPPRLVSNEALSSAIEQQVLREIYVSVTRARYRLVIVVSHGSSVTGVLADAAKHGLVEVEPRR